MDRTNYHLCLLVQCKIIHILLLLRSCPCQGRIGHENIDPSLLDLDLILLQVFVTAGWDFWLHGLLIEKVCVAGFFISCWTACSAWSPYLSLLAVSRWGAHSNRPIVPNMIRIALLPLAIGNMSSLALSLSPPASPASNHRHHRLVKGLGELPNEKHHHCHVLQVLP